MLPRLLGLWRQRLRVRRPRESGQPGGRRDDTMGRSHTFKFIPPASAERVNMPNPCTTCHTDRTRCGPREMDGILAVECGAVG